MRKMWGGVLLLALLLVWSPARAQTSGVTTGGTATTAASQALGTNSNRRGFIVQNNSASVTLYAACGPNSTGMTTSNMHQIVPGGNWEPSVPCLDSVFVLTASSTAAWVSTDY